MEEELGYTQEEMQAVMDDLVGQLESVQAANASTVRSLTARGKKMPPALTLLERLDTLIVVFLGDMNSPSRLAYEIQFERNMAERLDLLEKAAIRETLLRP